MDTSPTQAGRLRYNLSHRVVEQASSLLVDDHPAIDTLFADGFETGDTSVWSATVP